MAKRSTRRSRSTDDDAPRTRSRGQRTDTTAPPTRNRRSSSRRRRGGGEGEGEGGSTHRPAVGRDGKASISCPSCSYRYKIAEEHLEAKVTCTQCHRSFFPLAAAGSRRKPQDNSKPILVGVGAVVVLILIGVIVNSTSTPKPRKPPVAVAKEIPLGKDTREVQAVMSWARAIGTKDMLNARRHTDFAAMQKLLDIDRKKKYSSTFGEDQTGLQDKILNALFDSDQALVYRVYKPTMGRIMAEEMVAKKKGKVRLSLYPRQSKKIRESADVEVSYRWDDDTSEFRIHQWNVISMARVGYLEEQIEGKKPKGKHTAHELIGKATKRKISFAGKIEDIEEAELVPLPHHRDTPEADRKKIDELIDVVLDLNVSGILRNRATEKLIDYGKAAVPRLLNKMYEMHKMKTQDDVLAVNLLCRTLRVSSGWRFGFNPRDHSGSDLGGTDAERVSSLKQWYAWWARNYDRDDWKLEDSDEDIELTTEQQATKRKAKRQEKSKAAAEKRRRARGGK